VLSVGLCSDIHAHRHDQDDDVSALIGHIRAQPVPDVLICAGDISHRTAETEGFLRRLDLATLKLWVPGNHDIWVIDPESVSDCAEFRYGTRLPALSREVGWGYLPQQPALIPGFDVAVVGTTGWFTGEGYSEWFDRPAGPPDAELALRFAGDLRAQVDSLPRSTRLIIVTHHVSHSRAPSHDPGQGNTWSRHLEELINELSSRVLAVIHGHRHVRYAPVLIDGACFVAHPFGYPLEHARLEDGYTVVRLPL
jgi:predicted phosphohydrolase